MQALDNRDMTDGIEEKCEKFTGDKHIYSWRSTSDVKTI